MRNEQKWSDVRKIMKYIIKNTYNDGQESISQWIGNWNDPKLVDTFLFS